MRDTKELKRENRLKILEYQPREDDGTVDFYPAYIQLEQTNRCNAECIMCNHFYLGNNGCKDLPESVAERITSVLPYCETIMLNGDGEPFLCKTIRKNIERYVGYGISIGTNTNLCCIPEYMWEYLESSLSFLNISCDGASKETFELIRQNLSYDTFLRNLTRLRAAKPQLVKNFDCVVMKQNILELPDIVSLAAENGVASVRFRRLGVNPCIDNQSDSAELYYADLRESLEKARRIGHRHGVRIEYPTYRPMPKQAELPSAGDMARELAERQVIAIARFGKRRISDDYYSEKALSSDLCENSWNAGMVCKWAIERCYIDVNGNVTTCCFNMKKNMGSLRENTF